MFVLPLEDPLKVTEDATTLDELSGDRPELGVGFGTDLNRGLTSDGAVQLEIHQDQAADADELVDVLRQRRVTAWTGVHLAERESMEWLYLWLTCTLPNALSRMTVGWTGIAHDVIAPQFGWGAMATVEQRNLAYLTARTHGDAPNGDILHEIGVIGHGPGGDDVVDRFAYEIQAWDRGYRSVIPDFEIQPTTATSGTYLGSEADLLPQPIHRPASRSPPHSIRSSSPGAHRRIADVDIAKHS